MLEKGRLRAMVGGNDNRNFNRAITAKRQLGSTWKPLIYAAGMHLRWSPSDMLDNREGAFPFEGVWYYPRAAHQAPDVVSLAWAGTHSENLSSVWLLYHLTDRLSPEEFEQIAASVGMLPGEEEAGSDYLVRIRDSFGVISTRARYPELAYGGARAELAAELEATDPRAALEVRSLLYGAGTERERQRVTRRYSGRDRARRLAAIDDSFLTLEPAAEQCAAQAQALIDLRERSGAALADLRERSRPRRLFDFSLRDDDEEEDPEDGAGPAALPAPVEGGPALEELVRLQARLVEGEAAAGDVTLELMCRSGEAVVEGWRPLREADLLGLRLASVPLAAAAAEDLAVDGRPLTVGTLRRLSRATKRRALVLEGVDPYSLEALQHHPDFRLLVGLRFVAAISSRLGVDSELPPIVSMPLGAADISLEEAALMYQGILTGSVYRFPGEQSLPSGVGEYRTTSPVDAQARETQLIAQIRDREGNVLYRSSPEPVPVTDPVAGVLTGGVLHNVVEWGTGRRARGSVTVGEVPVSVPLFGKTGTTNSYRNAAFVGYVPSWRPEGGWSWEDGYTVAVYVGFDDNRKMIRGSTRLAGSSGALPAWIGTAQGLAAAGMLGQPDAAAPWSPGEAFAWAPVAPDSGLLLSAEDAASSGGQRILQWGVRSPWTEDLSVERRFWPLQDAAALPPPVSEVTAEAALEEVADEPLDDVWIPEMGEAP